MQRHAILIRSCRTENRTKMHTSFALLLCCIIGVALSYNVQRELPYNIGPNDPYIENFMGYPQEPSQRLFWGTQGSNQVGGTGLWATLTNKFPFLGNMFGRMELPSQYGVPNQYDIQTQYSGPGNYQPQFSGTPQFYQQPQNFRQGLVPSSRDVALTDDAVIVTAPFVPAAQPVPAQPEPILPPAQRPVFPTTPPAPEAFPGYQYNKPQYRLELPHK